MNRNPRLAYVSLAVLAALGVLFAGTSTYDFIAHLDRQLHAVSCSFVPGLGAPDVANTSGCFAVMMSPYASILRDTTWGGIPIALPALAVFIYLLFRAIDVLARQREGDRAEALFMVAATLLPVVMSLIYGWIAVDRVGAICKLCVGIYVASAGSCLAAVIAWRATAAASNTEPTRPVWPRWIIYFAEGVLLVALSVVLYLQLKPEYTEKMAQCGRLIRVADTYGTRVKLNKVNGGTPAVEVLDPLCSACRALQTRLDASELVSQLSLEGALFPLDTECNWMLNQSLHPGACIVSEAMLCAGERAAEVLHWSFAHQDELNREPQSIESRVREAFPEVARCLRTPAVKARLNKALRWVVANSLPVLTPQLYVGGRKLCDEDTELGLEYSLTRMLHAAGHSTPQAAVNGGQR